MPRFIQLKQVIRNKRFLLFTIFIPVVWYAFLHNVQSDVSSNIILGIAVFIGIIGNSLATFSKRISSNIDFYSFESRFTHYSVKKYLFDQTFVQIVLNALIFFVLLFSAVVFFNFSISNTVFVQCLLLMFMGLYFSIIGFVMGVRLDSKIIDTVSFPIIILAALMIIPFNNLGASGNFVDFLTKVQMIFPGYYYSNLINELIRDNPVKTSDILLFIVTFFLNILVLYFLIPHGQLKQRSAK
ncbi:ABC transporter [Streptococcus tangpeifui]|uniref:ABC transporter n=1 Tax=Streptococcus tangpeifui TaxID=2709400 RepID=UPI0013EA3ABA|nr:MULTISPECIES: ABC transporter [unclassified Streptococcus]